MASISTDKNGNRRIQFVDRNGDRLAIRLGKMPKKAVEAIKTKVEALSAAAIAGTSWDKETAEWLGARDARLYDKLAAAGLVPIRATKEQATLAAFLESYIKLRSDVKGSTATVYGHTKRCLLDYFGATKPLADITPGDCDAWRVWLGTAEKLADNTVNRRCGIAKQFFRAAERRKLIAENPFADIKGTTVRGNRARDFYVTREMADRVLDACPDAHWRLLFALSRFGGLRCPSEHLALRWGDVDWARNRITVHSPKTEHHEGKDSRVIPIFPELRPHLEAAFEQAEPGTEFVVTRFRDQNANQRTHLKRIIRRAGVTPWPKLFQNLRSTRQTELAESFPAHVVCDWIGNSQAIAREHYLQVTEDHFRKAAQKQAQQAAEMGCKDSLPKPFVNVLSAVNDPLRLVATQLVGDEGLEPPTSTV